MNTTISSLNSIKSFFQTKDLPLAGRKRCSPEEADLLFINATRLSQSFGRFVLAAMIDMENNTIETNFNSWQDLMEAYYCFCTGLFGNKC